MKKVLIALGALTVIAAPVMAVPTNQGEDRPLPGGHHDLSGDILGGGAAILYCPSEADDPGFRAAIAAVTGGTVDYWDSSSGVPDFSNYDCAFTWANFAYADPFATGDRMADLVDGGGSAVLGAFCAYTSGNSLDGRIMDPGYSPVIGGFNNFFFATYAGDGSGCIVDGVGTATGATYRDILTLQGDGVENGHFTDGEHAFPHNPAMSVTYANGAGGFPVDGNGPDWPQAVANGCSCADGGGTVPVEEVSWSSIKASY